MAEAVVFGLSEQQFDLECPCGVKANINELDVYVRIHCCCGRIFRRIQTFGGRVVWYPEPPANNRAHR